MLRRKTRVATHEKGQAMVEMAMVLPILLLLLCGIIDFGWICYNNLSLSYCSREGARYGIVHADDANAVAEIRDRVLETAPDALLGKITVTVTFSNPTSPRLGDITVLVSSTVEGLTPVASTIFGEKGVTLTSQCVMKVE